MSKKANKKKKNKNNKIDNNKIIKVVNEENTIAPESLDAVKEVEANAKAADAEDAVVSEIAELAEATTDAEELNAIVDKIEDDLIKEFEEDTDRIIAAEDAEEARAAAEELAEIEARVQADEAAAEARRQAEAEAHEQAEAEKEMAKAQAQMDKLVAEQAEAVPDPIMEPVNAAPVQAVPVETAPVAEAEAVPAFSDEAIPTVQPHVRKTAVEEVPAASPAEEAAEAAAPAAAAIAAASAKSPADADDAAGNVPAKGKIPGASIFMYIAGIIFVIVSIFMLYTAVSYTKTYLASYESTFADMWSHSLQYVIGQFVPYLGIGVVLLGLGRAIQEFRNGRQEESVAVDAEELAGAIDSDAIAAAIAARSAQMDVDAIAAAAADAAAAAVSQMPQIDTEAISQAVSSQLAAQDKSEAAQGSSEVAAQIEALTKEIEVMREITAIKFEETEKRQTYRLEDNRKTLEDRMAANRSDREATEKMLVERVELLTALLEKGASRSVGVIAPVRRERRFLK